MSHAGEHNLVVRNTFIDVPVESDDDADLDRSQSDPTGGRPKRMHPLMRISDPVAIPERPGAEEAGDDEADASDVAKASSEKASSVPKQQGQAQESDEAQEDCGIGGEVDDDEDDDSDSSPLERTKTVDPWPPDGQQLYMPPVGARGGIRPVALTSLLPVSEDQGSAGGYASGMPGAEAMAWQYMMPPMYNQYSLFQMGYSPNPLAVSSDAGREESAPSDWRPPVPALGIGPPLGYTHSFHQETRNMGTVSDNFRQFTKVSYEGRLSVVSESQVHENGVQRYLVQFAGGELSRADGVGFVFSPRLPCAKNIQRIVSIFVNARGRICLRVFADIVRASAFIKPLQCGDWVEMAIDLEGKMATFNIWPPSANGWPQTSGTPSSTAEFPYGNKLNKLSQAGTRPVNLSIGHLACVVKNVGVTINLGS